MASLLVLSGPSGVGKSTVARLVAQRRSEVFLSISATTRPPRPAERHGVEYLFVPAEEFDAMQRRGELLESAEVFGSHRYGTPRPPVEAALAAGRPVLLEIDVQGARQVKAARPEAITVFLLPPSWEALEQRLRGRKTEDEAAMSRRLATARDEMAAAGEFDHQVVNDDLEAAVAHVDRILMATPTTEGTQHP